jgi:hypothetical protein
MLMRAVLVLGLTGLSGMTMQDCLKGKTSGDGDSGGAGGGGVASQSASSEPGPAIANESQITRYPNEKKASGDVTLLRASPVRRSPPNGPEFAQLSAGTVVERIADVADGTLVVFKDASDGRTRMLGWIEPGSLNGEAGKPTLVKDAGREAAAPDSGKDAAAVDAGRDGAADAGARVDGGTHDAGSTKSADAGTAKADAGASKPADAGASASPAVRKAVSGKCDPGWTNFPTGSADCRKSCTADGECASLAGNVKCQAKGAQKMCR